MGDFLQDRSFGRGWHSSLGDSFQNGLAAFRQGELPPHLSRTDRRKGDAYIWKTNRALIEKGIISEPLTVQELFRDYRHSRREW